MKSIEQAVVEAMPHGERCPAYWSHVSGVTRCTCGVNGRRAKLLTTIQAHQRSTDHGYVYLR